MPYTKRKLAKHEKIAVVKIFRALSDYIAEGGKQSGANKVARDALFFIYEGGEKGKHDRDPKSKKASQLSLQTLGKNRNICATIILSL